jgi:hypothetical protein
MNVSEFERTKPRKTYKAIRDLEEELAAILDFGKREVDTLYIIEKIEGIKTLFLAGE